MISVITSVNNPEQYNKFFLPSINKLQARLDELNLPTLDLVTVKGDESITKNYNNGMRQAIYRIKVFVHQDVDLGDINWAFKLFKVFSDYPDCGLVGLVGTKKMSDVGMWWETGSQHVVGELFSGKEKADWSYMENPNGRSFTPVIFPTEVECIDGFFMATNAEIPWDENLPGFHAYDMDYSREVRKHQLKIMVMPHKAHHIGAIRNDKPDFSYYYKKWNLNG